MSESKIFDFFTKKYDEPPISSLKEIEDISEENFFTDFSDAHKKYSSSSANGEVTDTRVQNGLQLKQFDFYWSESGKGEWTFELEKLMLDHVGKGWKWKKISQLGPFQWSGISQNAIKRRFESDLRRKYRVLLKMVGKYDKDEEKVITDRTFKAIINFDLLENLTESGKILQEQADILLRNLQYFQEPNWSQEKKSSRSKQQNYIHSQKLYPKTSIEELIRAIDAVQMAIPQSKSFHPNKTYMREKQRIKKKKLESSIMTKNLEEAKNIQIFEEEENEPTMLKSNAITVADEFDCQKPEKQSSKCEKRELNDFWSLFEERIRIDNYSMDEEIYY